THRRTGGQRIELAGPAQRLAHLAGQLLIAEGLADVIGDPGLNRLYHVFLVATAGDHDERHAFQTILRTAPIKQLKAGHFRHLPVAEDQVEAFTIKHLLGLATVHRLLDANAGEMPTQPFLDQITDERRIIHHQHTDLVHHSLLPEWTPA